MKSMSHAVRARFKKNKKNANTEQGNFTLDSVTCVRLSLDENRLPSEHYVVNCRLSFLFFVLNSIKIDLNSHFFVLKSIYFVFIFKCFWHLQG